MAKSSYLLALDGSKESLAAANIAWKLAQAQNANLVALSVVDNQAIWDLLGAGLPGFIGSGPYIAAYETIQNALRSVSETLLVSFKARSQGHQINTECIINEGDLLDQVFERAKEHDLVILGRRFSHRSLEIQDLHSFIRTSLGKRLATVCPCPLLIVPSERTWSKARMIISKETFEATSLLQFLNFTEPLNLEREVFCTGQENGIDALMQEVKDIVPHTVSVLCHDSTLDSEEAFAVAADVASTTLLVVTTLNSLEGRETCSGIQVQQFLTSVPNVPVILLPPCAMAEQALTAQSPKLSSTK